MAIKEDLLKVKPTNFKSILERIAGVIGAYRCFTGVSEHDVTADTRLKPLYDCHPCGDRYDSINAICAELQSEFKIDTIPLGIAKDWRTVSDICYFLLELVEGPPFLGYQKAA